MKARNSEVQAAGWFGDPTALGFLPCQGGGPELESGSGSSSHYGTPGTT